MVNWYSYFGNQVQGFGMPFARPGSVEATLRALQARGTRGGGTCCNQGFGPQSTVPLATSVGNDERGGGRGQWVGGGCSGGGWG